MKTWIIQYTNLDELDTKIEARTKQSAINKLSKLERNLFRVDDIEEAAEEV